MSGTKGMPHYSTETKLLAIQMHDDCGLTYAEVVEQLGIRQADQISVWNQAYQREGIKAFEKPIERPRKDRQVCLELEQLGMENTLLKKSHTELRRIMLKARYRVIEHYRRAYAVSEMCRFFGISRAAYYAWLKRIDWPDPDAERKQKIMEAYAASKKRYGYRRIALWLCEKRSVIINHKAVLQLMPRPGIRTLARKRKPYLKMSQLESYHRLESVLNRDFSATHPIQKWVIDMTCIDTQQGNAYLSTIKNLFSGYIVAHALSLSNSVALVTQDPSASQRQRKDH